MPDRPTPATDWTGAPTRPSLPARAGQGLLRRASRHGQARRLDEIATGIAGVLTRRHGARRALQGNWLGHAAHPMLTDFTDGPWMAASFLDLFGPAGSEAAARRLVGFGLLSSVPTITSGLADWATIEGRPRRVGLVHAATSSLATVLYGASYLARRRHRQQLGVALGIIGGIIAFADGYVGGELSLVARAGTGRRD